MEFRPRIIAAYVFAIPLALILGILAASPDEITFMLVGMLLFFLAMPLFIKWHHALLIVFWGAAFNAYFLPGQPPFWLFFAGLSFGISMLNHILGHKPFIPAPELTRPLLFTTLVVVVTAMSRGGIGIKTLGASAHGGRYYVYIIGAILGYFALTAGQIPPAKSGKLGVLYFLSGTTTVLSNLAYTLGPNFAFLFWLVPSGGAMGQAASDFGLTDIDRISGLGPASIAGVCALLAHYGIRGLLEWTKPWRLLLLLAVAGASFFAGFRSVPATLGLIFIFQFCLEGLWRTRLLPITIGLIVFGFVGLALFANKMPFAVQRAVSFLPINVDASVRADAAGSTDWRVQMWALVWKQVPKYLLLGKGYSFDAGEMDITTEAMHLGLLNAYEEAMLAGDYHNGLLSIIIPFGLWGLIAFIWILGAGFKALFSNYRYGDPRLQRINSVLLSYYSASVISFFFMFGAFNSQLSVFLGVLGLSISLNSGIKRKPRNFAERVRGQASQAYAMEIS